jgi:hypothetical protein
MKSSTPRTRSSSRVRSARRSGVATGLAVTGTGGDVVHRGNRDGR